MQEFKILKSTLLLMCVLFGSQHAYAMCERDFKHVKTLINSGRTAEAIEKLSVVAKSGNNFAQYLLGQAAIDGLGMPVNPEVAAYWMQMAAKGGVPQAEFSYGAMLDLGVGVQQDKLKAVYWYTKAANQGNALAAYNLADMYIKGDTVKKSNTKALAYYFSITGTQDGDIGNKAAKIVDNLKQNLSQDEIIGALQDAVEIVDKGSLAQRTLVDRIAAETCVF